MKFLIYIFLPSCLFIVSTDLFAQDSLGVKNRYNIKASYNGTFDFYDKDNSIAQNYFRLELNYGVLKYLETGVQLFYTRHLAFNEMINPDFVLRPRYGIGTKVNFYPLQLVFQYHPKWMDFYLSTKIAYSHYFVNEVKYPFYIYEKFDYGIYGGLVLYLGKYFGIYTEIGKSNVNSGSKLDVNLGISVRF